MRPQSYIKYSFGKLHDLRSFPYLGALVYRSPRAGMRDDVTKKKDSDCAQKAHLWIQYTRIDEIPIKNSNRKNLLGSYAVRFYGIFKCDIWDAQIHYLFKTTAPWKNHRKGMNFNPHITYIKEINDQSYRAIKQKQHIKSILRAVAKSRDESPCT